MARLLGLVAAFLAAASLPASARDLDAIRASGTLRVLAVDGSPAFLAVKGPETGLERELLESFARRHELRVKVIEVAAWEELVPSLLADKGDLIGGGVNDTEERRKVIDFTSETFPTRDVVLTRRPTLPIVTFDELRRVKVGTIKGTALAARVAEAKVPRGNVDDEVPATGFAEALRTRRVVAVVDGIEDALLLKAADPELDLGLFLGPPASMAFGVRKDAPALRDALSEHLDAARKSGLWGRLVVKYFGNSAAEVLRKARGE